jgi:hypothetical protein
MKMHYNNDDLILLTQLDGSVPYLRLKQPALNSYLKNLAELAEENYFYLSQNSFVQYEFLQSFYSLNKQISSLSELIISDLTNLGWRENAIAAFLCTICPNPMFKPYFLNLLDQFPQNNHIINLALESINNDFSLINQPYVEYITKIRFALSLMKKEIFPLRMNPSPEELKKITSQNNNFKILYKEQGLEIAKQAIPNLLISYYLMPYKEWAKQGFKPIGF